MPASAVYAYRTEAGQLSAAKITKAYRDTYYPTYFLQVETVELMYWPTLGDMFGGAAEVAEEEEREPSAAERSPEVNSTAAEYWAKVAIGEARLPR